MTPLKQRMKEELALRGYSDRTIHIYRSHLTRLAVSIFRLSLFAVILEQKRATCAMMKFCRDHKALDGKMLKK